MGAIRRYLSWTFTIGPACRGKKYGPLYGFENQAVMTECSPLKPTIGGRRSGPTGVCAGIEFGPFIRPMEASG